MFGVFDYVNSCLLYRVLHVYVVIIWNDDAY